MNGFFRETRNEELFSPGENVHFLSSRAVFIVEVIVLASLCLACYNYPGYVLKVSCIAVVVAMCIFNHYVAMNYKSRRINRDITPPGLTSFYGIGTTMYRAYRSFGGDNIRYQFFTIFYLPVFPLGCYKAHKGYLEWHFDGFSRDYSIEGMVDSNAIEILNIYLRFMLFFGPVYWLAVSWLIEKAVWVGRYVCAVYS